MTVVVVWPVREPHPPEQAAPDSDQVTPSFDGSFMTAAEILMVCPCSTVSTEDGERLTEIGGELPQPAIKIAGSRLRKTRAKVNVLLR